MNAFSRTASGISMALLGTPRANQSVHRVSSIHGGGTPAQHVVLVTPDGEERGAYYEVSDKGLKRLMDGATPDYLGLEPHEPSEADEDEYERDFDRRRSTSTRR